MSGMYTMTVTKKFAKTLKKNRALADSFETTLQKVLENPRCLLDRKVIRHLAIFSAPLSSTGQGSGQRVLFFAKDSALIPFAISSHSDYKDTLNRITQHDLRPEREETVQLPLQKPGAVSPENILTALSMRQP